MNILNRARQIHLDRENFLNEIKVKDEGLYRIIKISVKGIFREGYCRKLFNIDCMKYKEDLERLGFEVSIVRHYGDSMLVSWKNDNIEEVK